MVDATTAKLGSSTFATGAIASGGTDAIDADTTISGTIKVGDTTIKLDAVEVKAGATEAERNKAAVTAINSKLGETGVLAEIDKDGKINVTQIKEGIALT